MDGKNSLTFFKTGGFMRVGVIVALIGVLIAVIIGTYFLGKFEKDILSEYAPQQVQNQYNKINLK